MKFGKELSSQMVQEWQAAYMDYAHLKNLLKDLSRFRQERAAAAAVQRSGTGPPARPGSLTRRLTMYRAFSGLTGRGSKAGDEDEAILVNAVEGSEDHYQTMFLRSEEEGGQYELEFFRKLDDEFNKVVGFYKDKVEEVKAEAGEMNKQMDALIALRVRVDRPSYAEEKGGSWAQGGLEGYGNSGPASVNGVKQGFARMDAIQEVEMSADDGTSRSQRARAGDIRPAPLEVLDHVKINVDPDTPVSTLRNIVMSSKSDLSFSKEELRKAEDKLRQAFTEFYQQLRLLKNYCFLNTLAFSKIMKKYDKITSRSASKAYLEMVDKSYLGSSDEVNKLIQRLEATFIKHFENGNHRRGMKSLKPGHKRERHRTTFFLGLFSGCSVALVAAIGISIHARKLLNHEGRGTYMENIFPLYSLFLFIVLHMLMIGWNTYLWKKFRINYPFIFGLKQGTELGFREIFLLASGLSLLALAAVLSNLDMEMDPRTRRYKTLTELVPLGLVLVVLLITFLPLNIIYRSSRYLLINCVWRCVCASLYKVTLPDFFMADQLTSQVQAIRNVQFYIYYYGLGDFTRRSNTFSDGKVYNILNIAVAIIPFWWRFLQCLRRLFEEKEVGHGLNSLKYLSTIVALVMRSIYNINRGNNFWRILAASTSGITTIYNTYWDIVIDWGLLQRNAKNPWLREKLLLSNKAVYFVAIVVNILLRLVWMQLVLDFYDTPFLHAKAMIALVACLEIIRRGIWNFFRLENEHFNNVGKYRAFKTVPLPFHYEDRKMK